MLPKKWYSSGTPQSPIEISGSAWENSRRQKTWLLKSHPEARLGNGIVHDLLSESHASTESNDDAPWHPALFAIGELADNSGARGASSATFLALAVGGANNILRLARLDEEEWRWKDEENVGLRLVNTSHYQPAVWDGGIGSIRRLKCVVNSKRYDPTRWLIVQWESETRVFQPEFRRTPTGPRLPGGEEASRIAVNPLFSLSRNQTGGHSHTDAAFNPNTRSKPPQLGLIDEKGYWSIWDVTGFKVKASRKLRTNLRKCGHIENGVLKQDGSGPRLKLGVAPGAKSKGQTTTLVTIYSTGNSWLDIFHINFAKHDPQFISFYREAIALQTSHDALQDTSLQAMQLHPVSVTAQPSQSLGETARLYAEQQIRFYQLVILDAQLRVTSELLQIIRQFDFPEDVGLVASEWEERFEDLQLIEPGLTLLDLRPPPGKASEWSDLPLADVYAKLQHLGANVSRVSEDSMWTMEIRPAVLRTMACDLYLSLRGLVYGRPDLSMTQRQPSPLPSSQLEHPDDMSIASSPAPQSQKSRGAGSQGTVGEKSQEDENEEEPAMALLRSYTGSGKFVPRKRFELLNQWQIGADPEDHVFDLDKEKEVTPGMQRRAKILARESRKRRRAETLLQNIQREPSLPTTQPAPEVRFSQHMQPVAPFSTQSQLHSDPFQTMSQPVAGAFAQRPKKRSKRKTGF
ncbi:hypothetical protein DL770_000117 [Monosporascus sp. CRB-9-2]|nr:hypothetical protein DL770_000117 [Monosporascus sp. CRB-9-2]